MTNHCSRRTGLVPELCERLNIRLFGEISFTSGWAQAIDQFGKNFHTQYNKARRVFKENKPESYTMNDADFVEVALSVWHQWATPADIMRCFQKVGIMQTRLAPEAIDRQSAGFTMPPPRPEPTKHEGPGTPSLRIRRNTEAYFKAKCDLWEQYAEDLEGKQLAPSETGIMDVPVAERKRKAAQIAGSNDSLQTGGSYTLGQLATKLQLREEKDAKEAAEKEERRQVRQKNKGEREAARQELHDAFWACRRQLDKSRGNGTGQRACCCGETPCKYAKYHHCSHCGDILTRPCAKAKCKEKSTATQLAATRSERY